MTRSNRLTTLAALVALLALGACAAPGVPAATTAPAEGLPPASSSAPDSAPSPAVSVAAEEPKAEPEPAGTAGPVVGVSLDAVLNGDSVTIPVVAIEDVRNAEFSFELGGRRLDFLAYVLDGELFVRAAACPPCNSTTFALDGYELICDACDTRFDGWTGAGLDGACVDYPKAAVAYEFNGDLVAMTVADLVASWEKTVAGSKPPEEAPVAAQPEPALEEEEEDSRPSCCR